MHLPILASSYGKKLNGAPQKTENENAKIIEPKNELGQKSKSINGRQFNETENNMLKYGIACKSVF